MTFIQIGFIKTAGVCLLFCIVAFQLLLVEGALRKTIPRKVTRAPSSVGRDQSDSGKKRDSNQLRSRNSTGNEALSQLLDSIFRKYHKELVPARPTTIKLDLLLLKVKSTIEKEGILETVVALFVEWEDKRMRWDPSKYENVTIMAFDSDSVWLPDIAMTNSADHLYRYPFCCKGWSFWSYEVCSYRYCQDMVCFEIAKLSIRRPDGLHIFEICCRFLYFSYISFLSFTILCAKYYRSALQCSFEFESWSLDSSTMTFNDSCAALVDDAFSSPQWELCQKKALVYQHYYNFTGELFTRVKFDFMVKRKAMFYVINLIFPCTTLSLIQLLVFAIPSTDSTSDRVGFGMTNMLTLVVFQTIVTAEMPKSSDAVTALSKYIIALIIISAVGIFESVIVERFLRKTTAPPKWLMTVMSILPLLWGSQLPSGIGQMLLEGNSSAESSLKQVNNSTKNGKAHKRRGLIASVCRLIFNDDPGSTASGPAMQASRKRKHKRNSKHHKGLDRRETDGHSWSNSRGDTAYSISNRYCDSEYVPRHMRSHNDCMTSTSFIHHQQTKPQQSLLVSRNHLHHYHPPNAHAPLANVMRSSSLSSILVRNGDYGISYSPARSQLVASFGRSSSSLDDSFDLEDRHGEGSFSAEETKDNIEEQLVRIQNGVSWGLLVTKIDELHFIICSFLVIFIPIYLFVPYVLFDKTCEMPIE